MFKWLKIDKISMRTVRFSFQSNREEEAHTISLQSSNSNNRDTGEENLYERTKHFTRQRRWITIYENQA